MLRNEAAEDLTMTPEQVEEKVIELIHREPRVVERPALLPIQERARLRHRRFAEPRLQCGHHGQHLGVREPADDRGGGGVGLPHS